MWGDGGDGRARRRSQVGAVGGGWGQGREAGVRVLSPGSPGRRLFSCSPATRGHRRPPVDTPEKSSLGAWKVFRAARRPGWRGQGGSDRAHVRGLSLVTRCRSLLQRSRGASPRHIREGTRGSEVERGHSGAPRPRRDVAQAESPAVFQADASGRGAGEAEGGGRKRGAERTQSEPRANTGCQEPLPAGACAH